MKKFLLLFLTLNVCLASNQPFKDGEVYIVDGDIPVLNLEEVERFLPPKRKSHQRFLMINKLASGVVDKWDGKARFELTYCISDDFAKRKDKVIEAMEVATGDWMNFGNIKFTYDPEEDSRCTQENPRVLFDVRPVNFRGYLARAFFPSTPRKHRNILIDSSSFSYSQTALNGILRHELGHVLGFRHEHISEDGNGKCREDKNFEPLTKYDKKSVMHYPQCGGENDILNLKLSEDDKIGISLVYN